MIARNIMKEREGWVDEAPRAIPSAAAWITSPKVVERERELGEEGVGIPGPEDPERSSRE